MEAARTLSDDERARTIAYGSLAIAVFRVPIKDVGDQIIELLDETAGRGDAYVLLVRRGRIGTDSPSAPMAWARDVVRRHRERLRAVAYVYPRGGFAASLARSLITGLFGALSIPARLFESEVDAVDWLGSLDGAPSSLRDDRDEVLRLACMS